MLRIASRVATAWVCGVSIACTGDGPASDVPHHSDTSHTDTNTPPVQSPSPFVIGEELTCVTPTRGFNRLVDATSERGFIPWDASQQTTDRCFEPQGGLAARDIDDDGDVDLITPIGDDVVIWLNDGKGFFVRRALGADRTALGGRTITVTSVIDLNGDALADVVASGEGFVAVAHNLGNLSFSPFEHIHWQDGFPRTCHFTHAWGDLDRDGDLDLLLPGLDGVPHEDWSYLQVQDPADVHGTHAILFENTGRGWSEQILEAPVGPGLSAVAAFSDRDGDGDLDILVGGDRVGFMPPMTTWRNDGGTLVEDSSVTGMNVAVDMMGLVAADLDGDGTLDYCTSDEGPGLHCMVGSEEGRFFDISALTGLRGTFEGHPELPEGHDVQDLPQWWDQWSIERVDLDADGIFDMVAAGGTVTPGNDDRGGMDIDAIWQGTGRTTFVDRSADLGFWDTTDHYGLVVEDFERDGFPDVVLRGPEGIKYWHNPCGDGAWIRVEAPGVQNNTDGWGAKMEAWIDERYELVELHALRSQGQGTPSIHVGLGQAERVDRLRVTWADGSVVEDANLPVRRTITARHPSAN